MEKKENEEIKKYLITFVSTQLSQCKIFTKVFGKNFALRSLKRNVNKVYTNEFDESMAAHYSTIDRNITFCTKNQNSKPLTVDDIKSNINLKSTMLHEGIHAVLNKSKIACKINGIMYGTGISEIKRDGRDRGKGLNEGLTNWICEKAGIRKNTYPEETNFIKQLELAFGEETIMRIAKGDIRKNVSKQLSMTPTECYHFLQLVDDIYNTRGIIVEYRYIEKTITDFINILAYDSEKRNKINQDFERMITSNPQYYQMQRSLPYLDFIMEHGSSLENELEFLKQQIELKNNELSEAIAIVESEIFNKYFKKDFDEILLAQHNSTKDYKKYIQLSKLMNTDLNNQKLEGYSSFKFLKNLEKILEQLSKSKSEQFRETYRVVMPCYSDKVADITDYNKTKTINKQNKGEQK